MKVFEFLVESDNDEYGWVRSTLTSFDEVWNRITRGRTHGDIYVHHNKNTVRITDKHELLDMLMDNEDARFEVRYNTYAWDDDNERITMSDVYKIRMYESEDIPVSTIKVSELKKMLSMLSDEDEVSFYSSISHTRFYPVSIKSENGKNDITLNRSADQDKAN